MEKYKPYIRKYWYHLLLGPFFMVLEACGEFILPFLSARIIDIGAANRDISYIFQSGLWMLLIAVGMLLTGVLGANFAIRGAAYLTAGVRRDAFARIQALSFSDIDTFSTGSLITRITNDMTQIQNFIQTMLRGMFRSPVMIIGTLYMSFRLNASLSRVLFIVVPLLGLSIAYIIMKASPRYTVMQKKLDDLNTATNETITNQRVIKSFVREEYEKEKFAKKNDALMQKSIHALKMMLLMQPVSAFFIHATTLAVVYAAGRQIMVGSMEIGTLTAFITYLSQVLTALNFLANIVLQGTRAAASDRRVSELMRARIALTDADAAEREQEITRGTIEFRHVSFRYFEKNTENVLEDVSFTVNAGECIGIIGSTGSGKSTLISLIPRLYDVSEGSVLVDGTDVRELSLLHLRARVAVVLQKNTLFSGTIRENLLWGNPTATQAELCAAARMAQAESFISDSAHGYETEIGQGGARLSGGQRQRLCIARALLKKPAILILDDATSAVDTATDVRIRHALKKELSGVTKLIIAQRIGTVQNADRILVLDGGRVVGFDKHEKLLDSCRTYREIYQSQRDVKGGADLGC